MRRRIADASASAARLLVSRQTRGAWEDFHIADQRTRDTGSAIGASDQWVTAYAGLALAKYARAHGDPIAREAACRAARWLDASRAYDGGWGYNGRTGPDVDSTAHAIALLEIAGVQVRDADREILRRGWQPGGGFTTFPGGPGAWAAPYADITPPAFRALTANERRFHRALLLSFLDANRRADGLWRSYWWSTDLYATYHALSLLHEMGAPIPIVSPAPHAASGPFELALLAGILFVAGARAERDAAVGSLLDLQQENGAWPAGAALRVPLQSDFAPWETETSRIYVDRGLFTTATVLSVLTTIGSDDERT